MFLMWERERDHDGLAVPCLVEKLHSLGNFKAPTLLNLCSTHRACPDTSARLKAIKKKLSCVLLIGTQQPLNQSKNACKAWFCGTCLEAVGTAFCLLVEGLNEMQIVLGIYLFSVSVHRLLTIVPMV